MRFAGAGTAVAVIVSAALGCTREPTASLPSVSIFITRVVLASDTTVHGVLVHGPLPSGSSGGLTVTAPPVVINGGSAVVTVSAGASFNNVVVGITGRPDYYIVTLPSPQTTVDLILTMSPTLPSGSFQWNYGVGASATAVGSYTALAVSVLRVLSGDVQVSISWDSPADVDLHVVEPGTEEIYYGNVSSTAGGLLDLDSNAACTSDGPRNENVTYPSVTPPSGTYTVRVDYWSSCAASGTNYVVTVLVKNHAPQTFTGTFTGSGDGGGAGSGVTIGTFTFP